MSQRKRRSNESTSATNPSRESKPTPTSITSREMEAFGLRGAGVALTAKERAGVRKVIMFPFVGDTKATCVRPRVSFSDIAAAQRLTHRPTASRKRCTAIRTVHYPDQVAA